MFRTSCSFVITAIVFLMVVIMISNTNSTRSNTTVEKVNTTNGMRDITTSTVNRTPLNSADVVESDLWFDNKAGWDIRTSVLTKGMKEFYKKTGVQPYLIITTEINGIGEYLLDSEAVEYLEQQYDTLFHDEGHLIYAFMEYSENRYKQYIYAGNKASAVIDREAQEIIYDYADALYTTNLEDDEYFRDIFVKSADRIMVKTVTKEDNRNTTIIVIGVIIVAIIAVAGIVLIQKRSREKASEYQKILDTPMNNTHDGSFDDLREKYKNDNT